MKSSALLFLLLSLALPITAHADPKLDDYKFGPDSEHHDGVPQGKISERDFDNSKVFADTHRKWWVYVPAQYDGKTPAAVMVFQDGKAYLDGAMRAPIVFDNLIAKGEMPVTIGIFINPGNKGPADPNGHFQANNRSFEYDTMSADYSKFLIDEILPEVAKEYKLTDDPDGRAICGMSSGGICAFTVAWERPDYFRKVLSHIGSFTNIRGGEHYPWLIRQTKGKAKPIRVYLQDGENDLDNEHGDWPLANKQMAAALKYAGYDFTIVWGHGTHNPNHGGAILPDSLRWLWRDYKPKGK